MKNIIRILKFSATGNIFVLLDLQKNHLAAAALPRLAKIFSRDFMTDGLVAVDQAGRGVDLSVLFFNPDGSRAFCGNGTRTAGFYQNRLIKRRSQGPVVLKTDAGKIVVDVRRDQAALTDVEPPKFLSPNPIHLRVADRAFDVYHVWSGCPHAVIFSEKIDEIDIQACGRAVRWASIFQPQGVNVDFVEVQRNGTLSMRTFERGVERETKSCGSGALASAFAVDHLKLVNNRQVSVKTLGGNLVVSLDTRYRLAGRVDLLGDFNVYPEGYR